MSTANEFTFPSGFFDPPSPRPESWPDNFELRRAVDWFKGFMTDVEWIQRRNSAATRMYKAATGDGSITGDGRFFNAKDTFGWYLFLSEARLDHVGNYDYVFGSRVVPLMQAIGRDLDLLLGIEGMEVRVRRMVGADRAQPNGCLFELLIAACYRRAGAEVVFVDEKPGKAQTHDMDVTLNGQTWAIECKRMEVGAYGERERQQIGRLWNKGSNHLAMLERSTLCHATFRVELETVPDDYLSKRVSDWLSSGRSEFTWDDAIATGSIADLDLRPLQQVLSTDLVFANSHRILELLTGMYRRNASYRTMLRANIGDNPRYVDACDLAVVLHWESLSKEAIDGKARDIRKKLSEATSQLPEDRPGIIHVGFEAVEGDRVERLRYAKILATARQFDPGDKPLEYVYCHYFVPESPPDECWAFDETTQWCSIQPRHPRPLGDVFLVLSTASQNRTGPHWRD